MDWIRTLATRAAALFWRRELEEELDDELRARIGPATTLRED